MTLTQQAFASSPTAHLARWRGGPSAERVKYLRAAFFKDDDEDAWTGRKISYAYGLIYHVTRLGLVPVQYDGNRMIEGLVPRGPVYSWDELKERGY